MSLLLAVLAVVAAWRPPVAAGLTCSLLKGYWYDSIWELTSTYMHWRPHLANRKPVPKMWADRYAENFSQVKRRHKVKWREQVFLPLPRAQDNWQPWRHFRSVFPLLKRNPLPPRHKRFQLAQDMGSAAIKAPPTSGIETPTHEEVANDTPAVLSILNLDQSISHLSTTARKTAAVVHVVSRLLHICPCTTPDQVIDNTSPTHHSHDKVHKSIMRFVREPDRWTALASVLFKSMAYHRSVGRLPSTIEKSVDDSDFD